MANHVTYHDQTLHVGDRIVVAQKITEDEKTRLQNFDGLLIAIRGREVNTSITVRKIATGAIGVERIYPLNSPNIDSIVIKSRGHVRRAKLTYLRHRVGRQAMRVKEDLSAPKTSPKTS